MIAPTTIPEPYRHWNTKYGAPNGHHLRFRRLRERLMPADSFCRAQGPFSIQFNNSTRAYEYPWAFDVAKLKSGMRVLEVGGGLCGFQFVLDRAGCRVVNVDPGMEAGGVGWPCDQNSIARLNRIFSTKVELRNTTIGRTVLGDAEFDRAFCISVIEHLPAEEAVEVMAHVYRCLKPGGLFILTVDLFLNVKPFASRLENEYGANRNIAELIRQQPWELAVGRREELHGFPEFDADKIMCQLEKYLIRDYPAMSQCLVLQKPA